MVDFTVDLPDRSVRGKTNWHEVVRECKENRGKYGFVGEFSHSMASQIRRGAVAAFLPRPGMDLEERVEWMRLTWDITSRVTPENASGKANLYVRYVGP